MHTHLSECLIGGTTSEEMNEPNELKSQAGYAGERHSLSGSWKEWQWHGNEGKQGSKVKIN